MDESASSGTINVTLALSKFPNETVLPREDDVNTTPRQATIGSSIGFALAQSASADSALGRGHDDGRGDYYEAVSFTGGCTWTVAAELAAERQWEALSNRSRGVVLKHCISTRDRR